MATRQKRLKGIALLALILPLIFNSPKCRASLQAQSPEAPEVQSESHKLQIEAKEAVSESHTLYVAFHVMAIGINPSKRKTSDVAQYVRVLNGLDRPEFFTVRDDGKVQKIDKIFREEDASLRLGIVIETDKFTAETRTFFSGYLSDILRKRLRPQDKYLLIAANSRVNVLKKLADPSPDVKKLLNFNGVNWNDKNPPRIQDSIAAALRELTALEETPEGGIRAQKKVLMVVRDHESADSSIIPEEELVDLSIRSGVQIFSVTLDKSPNSSQKPITEVSLAGRTGGLSLIVYSDDVATNPGRRFSDQMWRFNSCRERLLEIFSAIQKEIIIGYYLAPDQIVAGSWHQIEIELNEQMPEVQRKKREQGLDQFKNFQLHYPVQYFIP